MNKGTIDDLILEFKSIGLLDYEARRYTFCAVTNYSGWNSARIGRYLGVSRARIGQRIDRLEHFAKCNDMPVLSRLLQTAQDHSDGPDIPIGFPAADWENDEFALGILYQFEQAA